jgi:hypothetical protein
LWGILVCFLFYPVGQLQAGCKSKLSSAELRKKPSKSGKNILTELEDLQDEYHEILSSEGPEAAKDFLDNEYPALEARAIKSLAESGLIIQEKNGKKILMPSSEGVYGRVASHVVMQLGYIFVLDFRANIENDFHAMVVHQEKSIFLPMSVLEFPRTLSFSLYHELRHVFMETHRGQARSALKSKVFVYPPMHKSLVFNRHELPYSGGYSIEELVTFYNDILLLNRNLDSKFLGMSAHDNKFYRNSVRETHKELLMFTLKSLRAMDEVLMGISSDYSLKVYSRRSDDSFTVSLISEDNHHVILRLSLSGQYFKNPQHGAGKEEFATWVRKAILEIENMREKLSHTN